MEYAHAKSGAAPLSATMSAPVRAAIFSYSHYMSALRRTIVYPLLFILSLLSACTILPQKSTVEPLSESAVAPASLSPVQMVPPHKLVIALALGGGAARGFAHVGVIKALESQGIIPDIVVGTSAGSLVGALYAAGNNGFALQKMAQEMDESSISDWSIPFFSKVSGVLKGEGVQNYVNRAVNNVPIEKFKLIFGAVATDLQSGQPILFRRGNAGIAVRASSAVPGVFQSVKIGQRYYVDGGLVAPVPVSFAREMGADFVIAVNISAQPQAQASSSSVDVMLQSFAIMGQTINSYELKGADIVIQPSLGSMKGSDFAGRNVAILAGEQAAMNAMPEIRQKLKMMQAN